MSYSQLISVAPHITPFEFEGESNTGDGVQLTCYVSKGDVPLEITWTLNGKSLGSQSGVSITPIGERTNILTIASVKATHAGEYTCLVKNMAGSASHTATLYINGRTCVPQFLCKSFFVCLHSPIPCPCLPFYFRLLCFVLFHVNVELNKFSITETFVHFVLENRVFELFFQRFRCYFS